MYCDVSVDIVEGATTRNCAIHIRLGGYEFQMKTCILASPKLIQNLAS